MELSNEVAQGLNYLANGSYISEDNYKKIVNSCLGLLSGEQSVERVSNICPEKSDIIKQIYASLLSFSIEIIRNKAEDEVQHVMAKHNFKSDRIEYFIKLLNLHHENIVKSLENCTSGWPNLVDIDWKLDYIVKSNLQNHVEGPVYYIVLTTEKNSKLNYVKFICDQHQLQDFSTKLKEIVCHIEKISNDMSEIWNLWDVVPPPVCTVKTKLHHKEVNSLRDITFDAVKTLSNIKVLDVEAGILSRFLYKYKRIFHHDKGMQNLVKVNQCLRKYLKLNMFKLFSSFLKTLPRTLPATATHAYLPTKGMLKWVLLRLQAFSQIFVRVLKLTKEIGVYVYQKMNLGWTLHHYLLVYSMTARILVLSKYLLMKSIEWYNSFYKCLPLLIETANFLPEYKFPKDIKKWLGPLDLIPLQKKTIDHIFELIDMAKEKKNNFDDFGDDDDDDDDEDNGKDDDEVKIVSENLIKNILNINVKKRDDDDDDDDDDVVEEIKEIIVDEVKSKRKGVKRPLQCPLNEEDIGVPIYDEEIFIKPKKKKRKKKSNILKINNKESKTYS